MGEAAVDAMHELGADARDAPIELSVVLPCLDEADTVATCVGKALKWMHEAGVSSEVVVADNGSTDGSAELALAAGARVIGVRRKGYGNALNAGIRAARGEFVVMADSDDSYELDNLTAFLDALRAGNDLVMGDRF